MRLSRIRITDFRGIESLAIDFGMATVLIGPNNAGKTTITEAIRYVLGEIEPSPGMTGRMDRPARGAVDARLTDLSPAEQEAWGPFLVKGSLLLRREVPSGLPAPYGNSAAHCVLLDDDGVERLAGAIAARRGDPDAGGTATLPESVPCERYGDWWKIGLESAISELDDMGNTLARRLEVPSIQWLPGPQAPPPDPLSIVAAAFRERLVKAEIGGIPPLPSLGLSGDEVIAHAEACLDHLISWMEDETRRALEEPIRAYVPEATQIFIRTPPGEWQNFTRAQWLTHAKDVLLRVFEQAEVSVALSGRDTALGDYPTISELGSGARRAAGIAALEIFLAPEWQSTQAGTLLIVEEPEAGMHPAALRRITRQLRQLPDAGVQLIVTTHSPAVVNAVDPSDVRTLGRERAEDGSWRTVARVPGTLREICEQVGATPGDVLLGDRFVVVEGPRDVEIYRAWMRAVGADPDREGIHLIHAGGGSRVATLAQFIHSAYRGARFWSLYDGDQLKVAREATRELGDAVAVRTLRRKEIESYLHPGAVIRRIEQLASFSRRSQVQIWVQPASWRQSCRHPRSRSARWARSTSRSSAATIARPRRRRSLG
jgi:energy-coupling factor transporter ATP-binding protein EcfA2